jgi:mxaC protein
MSLYELQWGVPEVLFLLPLLILPWISNHTTKTIVWSQFIPADPVSKVIGVLFKLLTSLAFVSLILALASPYYPEQIVQKMGSGAEVIILLDRSRSMDEAFTSRDKAVAASRTVGKKDSKRRIANQYLLKFINNRPDDRLGVVLFSNNAVDLLSFSYNHDTVRAVINASSLGKGLSETNIAQALIKAAEMYAREDYHGSRTVLLISDGGQELTTEDKYYIRSLFQQQRITLYWLYMGGIKGLTANKDVSDLPNTPDKKLHAFFETLTTPYIGFNIESPKSISDTLEKIDTAQQQSLIVNETLPRKSMDKPFLLIAMIALFILLLSQIYTIWGITKASH